MKKILFTTLLVASFGAASSHANEVSSETYLAAGVNPQATESLRHCLQSDAKLNYSKAIRAYTKAYKASIPNYDVRSDILTRRGWLTYPQDDLIRLAETLKLRQSLMRTMNLHI